MRTALVLLLAFPGVSAAGPLLVAVLPDLPGPGPGDEGFAVGCIEACDLTGSSVSDGESSWTFPSGISLVSGEVLWIAGNRTTW
ncbi:MAG: hypothetical protein WC876_11175, partial [Candidatus Thermoplasmatota archaeon]